LRSDLHKANKNAHRPVGVGLHPSDEKVSRLKAALASFEPFRGLSVAVQAQLERALIEAMGQFSAAHALRKSESRGRGRKPDSHKAVLLEDCRRAWSNANGCDEKVWQNEYGDESESVGLYRCVYEAMTGCMPDEDLKRSITSVREIEKKREKRPSHFS
jgi:hypothetical protein